MGSSSNNNNINAIAVEFCCYLHWIGQHNRDITEIIHALSRVSDEENCLELYGRIMDQFEDYLEWSWALSLLNTPTLFSRSFQWMGSVRPSMFIRLMLMICGMRSTVNLVELDNDQLREIRELLLKTAKEEDELHRQMTSLQASFRKKGKKEMVKEFETNFLNIGNVYNEADELRLDTLIEVLGILTPFQVVELLISFKKLVVSLHNWNIVLHGPNEDDE